MNVILQAPHPLIETTTILPSPKFSDQESPRSTVEIQRAIDGTKYSYVKKNQRRKLQYLFRLTRLKALELRAFIYAYYRATILVTNHKGEVWRMKFVSNPFEFSGLGRAKNSPGNEYQEITLELEGTLESAGPSTTC
jgi:hypothetical protein